ncbi:hypothetical protein K2X89_15855 [Myxococcota bacterium]|nr:hypothetical protein [Myxococcota bacterium]
MNGGREREIGSGRLASGRAAAREVGAPWFVQFWPLFIAFLMLISIAASVATVFIAYRHADVDVRQTSVLDGNGR